MFQFQIFNLTLFSPCNFKADATDIVKQYIPILPPLKTKRAIMVFRWVSAHISGFNIGAPIQYAHSILHVSDHLKSMIALSSQVHGQFDGKNGSQ